MNTSDVVKAYLATRRAQGVQIRSGAKTLRQFARETGDLPLDTVTPQAVATFLRGNGALSATWTTKFRLLSGLYRFALHRDIATISPLPELKPKLPPQQTPYVYTHDELRRLLDATTVVRAANSALQATTYRTMLLLLYGAGLRISEAIGLTLTDVDLSECLLTIRNAKFYKTRLVPIGPELASALTTYYEQRSRLAQPMARDSAFLCTRSGRQLMYKNVGPLFRRIRAAAGIVCPPNEPRPPRLHDLRHTAAVHRVLAWYRSGRDVQLLLPKLATYLGHANITSTQRYLLMTPELMFEASRRFETYALEGHNQESHHA